jgi:hypothetical protein
MRRWRPSAGLCADFKVPHPKIKGATQPDIQQQEGELKSPAQRLRMVRHGAPG